MLYTNKTLEFCNNRRGEKVLELCNNYGNNIIVQADRNLDKKVKSVINRFHLALNLVEYGPRLFRLTMDTERKDTYLILNSKDECNYQYPGKIFYDDKFRLRRQFYFNNRSNTCQWELSILKLDKSTKQEPGLVVIQYTSGCLEYIVVDNGKVQHFNHAKMLHKYPNLIEKAEKMRRVAKK